MAMRIVDGADPFGVGLKESVKAHLSEMGHECVDVGGSTDEDRPFYQVAAEVARSISANKADRGILFCGTGMGVAIIANKFNGVYAAVCENTTAASNARSINNANVLTMGAMVTAPFLANQITETFLNTEFTAGWDAKIKAFLEQSTGEIQEIEAEVFR